MHNAPEAPARASFPTKLAATVGLVLALFAGLVVTATAASAHHAELSATASCSNDGRYVVDFTARSWRDYRPQQDGDSWRALNPNVEVLWRFPGGTKTVAATGAFTAGSLNASKVPVFSGQIVLPVTTSTKVELQTHAISGWGPNPANGTLTNGNEWWPGSNSFVTVNLPTGCQKPKPAFAINECATGGIAVTLTNPGGTAAANFTVNGVNVTVQPDQQSVQLIPAAENQTVQVKIKANGTTLFDQPVLRDCQHPAPSVAEAIECAEGGLGLTLINTGTEDAVFTVNGANVTVPAGGRQPYLVPVAENQTAHVTITSGGTTLLDRDLTRDCLRPVPSVGVADTCTADGIAVPLTNGGDDDATFTVNGSTVTVAPGQTVVHVVPAAENETVRVTVASGGTTLLDRDLTRDCLHPVPSVGVADICAADGIAVPLTNGGDDDATFTVNGSTVTVAPGQTVVHVVPAAENETVRVTVASGGTTLLDEDLTRDCLHPAPVVEIECSTNGLTVVMSNTGDDDAVFTISGDNVVTAAVADGADFTVEPGQSATLELAIAEEATVHLTVDSAGGTLFDDDVTRDCQEPQVTLTDPCIAGSTELAFSNSGDEDVVLTVTKNGVAYDEVTVLAGTDELVVLYPLADGEEATFRVTGPGFDSGPLTAACPDPITPTTTPTTTPPTSVPPNAPRTATQTPAATPARTSSTSLASTGASTLTLIVVAAGLLTAGGLLLGTSRRRRLG